MVISRVYSRLYLHRHNELFEIDFLKEFLSH